MKDIEVKIETEEYLGVHATGKITFPSMVKKYLEFSKTNKVLKSYKRDDLSLRCLQKFFGNVYLREITPERIEKYKTKRLETVKPTTVNRELVCLKHLFNKAIEYKYVIENPVKSVKLFRESPGRVRYLEQDEIQALLKECSSRIKPLVMAALTTGMRHSELFNLKWEDIDFKENQIRIRNSKSNESCLIPINDILRATLERIYQNQMSLFAATRK